MGDFTFNPLLDPARRKGAALRGAPGTDNYPQQVAAYNNWLYTPMDRRPTPTSPAPLSSASSAGWHGPTAPVTPGTYSTQYGNVRLANPMYTPPSSRPVPNYNEEDLAAMGGIPSGGASTAPAQGGASGQKSIIDTAPLAVMPPAAPQNAMQRWSGGSGGGSTTGGMMPLSNARRYFWATGNIDGRAPQADPSMNKGAVQSPNFNNEVPGHSNWQPGQAGFTFNAGGGHSEWSPW